MHNIQSSAIVVGAGIVGLATARALAMKGYKVKVFDRSQQAVGASIRNFGMIWPIGQPPGELYEAAMHSRQVWKTLCDEAGIWYEEAGSLHVAHHADEKQVLEEMYEILRAERQVEWWDRDKIISSTDAINSTNLQAGLYCAEELIVDPREAIAALPFYLKEKFDVEFYWGKCISYVSDGCVYIGNDEQYEADNIFICSGADLETLYPELYTQQPITKCKLQMMRLTSDDQNMRIGPALCGGLSLIHYNNFKAAPSLINLRQRYKTEMAEYLEWGIHVMVSQNEHGELTVGDSHEYGLTHDPFDKQFINQLILNYLKTFASPTNWKIKETWNGIYPKLTNGEHSLFIKAEQDVYIINGFGGAGMTLSFGLVDRYLESF